LGALCAAPGTVTATSPSLPSGAAPELAWIDIPPYQGDAIVRGSESLSKTKDGQIARVAF